MTPADPVRVRRLSTGAVRGKRAPRGVRRYLPGGWADYTLPVNVFLIEHPDGVCLFDAGQSARAAGPGYLSAWHPFLRLARFELVAADEAGAQIRALGYEPRDVRWVVLSHLHTDHVGGLEPFARTEILVTRTEWERFRGLRGRIRGYLPQHWPAGVEPTLVDLDGPPLGPFGGTLDLTGDGALLLVSLPGHTPGHLALLAGDYLIAGDAAHSPDELPADVLTFCRARGLTPLLTHDPGAEALLEGAAERTPPLDLVGTKEGT